MTDGRRRAVWIDFPYQPLEGREDGGQKTISSATLHSNRLGSREQCSKVDRGRPRYRWGAKYFSNLMRARDSFLHMQQFWYVFETPAWVIFCEAENNVCRQEGL